MFLGICVEFLVLTGFSVFGVGVRQNFCWFWVFGGNLDCLV